MANTYDNWQPRLGLAYRLRSSLVLRASAGRFFENWAGEDQYVDNVQGSWPDVNFLNGTNLNNPSPQNPTPTHLFADPANLGTGTSIVPNPSPFATTAWSYDPKFQNPYSIQWNFGVQDQLGSNVVLEADYLGAHDSRLDVGGGFNTAVKPGTGDAGEPFPYMNPQYTDKSIGRGNYDAFQFKMERRASRGLAYLISYTYSKTINLGCDSVIIEGCSVPNPYDLRDYSRSVAGFDITHLLNVSWLYQLPVGKGQRFASGNRVLDAIVGKWALNGIFSARSGEPYEIQAGGDYADTGGIDQRAQQTCVNVYPSVPTRSDLYNANCFSVPAAGTFGNEGRYSLRTPHVTNWDLSLFKDFPLHITESSRMQFRAEFFNAFNLQALGIPQGQGGFVGEPTLGTPTFGESTTTAQTEREIQFALKLFW
jgi:hypothetical protein